MIRINSEKAAIIAAKKSKFQLHTELNKADHELVVAERENDTDKQQILTDRRKILISSLRAL